MEILVKNLFDINFFSSGGIFSKVIKKTQNSNFTLFCMAANTSISEHTTTREASIIVLNGKGSCYLNGEEVTLEMGTFIFMPPNTPHALRADTDLSFLLTITG